MRTLDIQSRRIDEVLVDRARNADKADLLFEQYTVLRTDDEREAFVAALVHRMLTERARRIGQSPVVP